IDDQWTAAVAAAGVFATLWVAGAERGDIDNGPNLKTVVPGQNSMALAALDERKIDLQQTIGRRTRLGTLTGCGRDSRNPATVVTRPGLSKAPARLVSVCAGD